MDSYSIAGITVVGIIFLGAAIQTFHLFPTFFDSYFDFTASKITVAFLLILVSFLGVSAFLQFINRMNREGFEEQNKAMAAWKTMAQTYYIEEVCAIQDSIKQKLVPIYKQQENLTDQQAEEKFQKVLSEGTSNGAVSCGLVKPVMDAKDIDSFFTAVQLLPNSLLIQVQETAMKLNSMVQKQYDEVMKSLEGFVDPSVGICSPEVTEERRKFLREKKLDEAAQRCLLPEEVPLEKKDTVALGKVKKIQEIYDAYIRMPPKKPLIGDLVTKTKDLLNKLDEKKKKAESGEILNELKLPE